MGDVRGSARQDPVLAAWSRLRRFLHARARVVVPAAVLIWVGLAVATIVVKHHATFGIATVGFGLSVVISLARSGLTTPRETGTTPGKPRRVPDTAFLPEFVRQRTARPRLRARAEATDERASDEP
jgi:hypothetical protein